MTTPEEEMITTPPANPVPETETKSFDERRAQSMKDNLRDENKIRLLNAQYIMTAADIPDGDSEPERVQQREHTRALCDEVIGMVDGIERHLATEFTIIREQAREIFTLEMKNWKSPDDERMILNAVAKKVEEMVAEQFTVKGMIWANGQNAHNFQFIEEQTSKGVGRTLKDGAKDLVTGRIIGKVGRKLLGKDKHKVR